MEMDREFRDHFRETFGSDVVENAPLSEYSTFHIGGPADLLFEARSKSRLHQAVQTAVREGVSFYVFGGGSNILFDDAGFRGLLIRNRIVQPIRADKEGQILVSAGTDLRALVGEAAASGLAGLEFLSGIPGTVGGAVHGNAGAFGGTIGDILDEARILEVEGGEKTLSSADLEFGYRRSSFQGMAAIVLEAVLKGVPGDREAIQAKNRDYREKRRANQPPWGTACPGSYFKNAHLPDGQKVAAGFLLEKVGAKGMSVGDAAIYEGHANFIVNRGRAQARDVLRLAQDLKERVFKTFAVHLEEEVIYLPATASML